MFPLVQGYENLQNKSIKCAWKYKYEKIKKDMGENVRILNFFIKLKINI